MSTLFERYKEALLRGHLAARQGEPELALTCYEDAAAFAPDRPLPHSARGAMLLRLHRPVEAAAAFADALERAPGDPGALAGRGESLAECGRPAEGAAVLDKLVTVLVGAKSDLEALEVAARSLELAESKPRRKELIRRIDAVRNSSARREAAPVIARAEAILAAPVARAAVETAPPGPAVKPSKRASWVPLQESPAAPAVEESLADGVEPAPEPEPAAEIVPEPVVEPAAEIVPEPVVEPAPEPEPAAEIAVAAQELFPTDELVTPDVLEVDPRASLVWAIEPEPVAEVATEPEPESEPAIEPEPVAEVATEPEPAPAPAPERGAPRTPSVQARSAGAEVAPEPAPRAPSHLPGAADGDGGTAGLRVAAEAALDAGDGPRATLLLIDLAREDAAQGRRDAALDSCYRALAVAPDDLTLHLLLVQLYVERGWRDLAAEKLELLERLSDLDGDTGGVELVRSARRVVARTR